MTDYDLLLRSVLIDPRADLPRLVLADYLEENGRGDRAEFIRVSCELATTPHKHRHKAFGGEPCGACDLRVRGRRLLRGDSGRNWRHWAGVAVQAVPAAARYADHLDFRRGFVSAVTLTQAAFMGGECQRCGGSGRTYRSSWLLNEYNPHATAREDCPACAGTGRVPGLAAALFEAQPITSVVLSEARPHDCGRTVEWYRSPERWRPEAALCPELYEALAGGGRQTDPTPVASYATAGEATRAASASCVAYGRGLAGLPPLAEGVQS